LTSFNKPIYIEADEQTIEVLNSSALTTTRGKPIKPNERQDSYEGELMQKRGSNVTYNFVASETDNSQFMVGHLPQLMTAQDFFNARPELGKGQRLIKRS
jgi:hypothetical protein